MNDGPPNAFDFHSRWSMLVTTGAALGITMLLVVFLVLTPTAIGLRRAVMQMQQNPTPPPPPDLSKLQKRLGIIPAIAATLLLAAEVFMVAAAQF
jgi:hypothetical protein